MVTFKKVDFSFLEKNLRRAGIDKQVTASQHIEIVEQVLIERFGEGAGVHVKPKYIKHRRVMVEIAHPAIGQEIRAQEEAIISEINKRIGLPEIIQIQFSLPRGESEYSE
ncbi:DciA family protein [Patescibacteria group bacterium]